MVNTLFAGGEDSSFSPFRGTAGMVVSTDSTRFRAAWSRCNLLITGDAAVPPVNRLRVPFPWTPTSDFWLHAWFYCTLQATANIFVTLMDSGYTILGAIQGTGVAGQVALGKISGSVFTTLATSGSGSFPMATLLPLDVHVRPDDTVIVYIGGVEKVRTIITGIGGNVGSFDLCSLCGGQSCSWSEIIAQDGPTMGKGLYTLVPAANGNTNTWTGSVSNVNEVTINDGTYNLTSSNNQAEQYTVTYSPTAGNYNIDALVTEARISTGSVGPTNFEWDIRTRDGSDHTFAAGPPTGYFDNYMNVWQTNPHVGGAWTVDDFKTGFNLGIESLA